MSVEAGRADGPPAAILIAGPTASGKSALALRLAEDLGGTIINADSMQVYAELRILTARPSAEEEARVPHALFGHVPAREAYSAGRFLREAEAAVREAQAAGRLPILVGGTGLYFKAFSEGLSPIPDIPDDVRAHWRAEAERLGAAELHRLLAARDPDMAARLEPGDTQRLTRAHEVLAATGRSLAYWQSLPGTPVLGDAPLLRLVMRIERAALYRRCDERLARMVEAGAVDEAARCDALHLDPTLPVMTVLGLREFMAVARGEAVLGDALEAARARTRQYAKRQETWLSKHMIAWCGADAQQMESDAGKIVAQIQSMR